MQKLVEWYEKCFLQNYIYVVMMMHKAEYVKTYCKVSFVTVSIAMLWGLPELPPLIGCGLLLQCAVLHLGWY